LQKISREASTQASTLAAFHTTDEKEEDTINACAANK
jgi:hypothetical protein